MALDSLDEIRENAREAFQAYQERIKRHYEKLVKPRMFTVGDLVLRAADHVRRGTSAHKFAPKW